MHHKFHPFNAFHHFHFKEFIHNKYNELVIAETFRYIALSLIALFVPLFLIELGYSIIVIAIMEAVSYILCVFAHYYILKYLHIIGVKRMLISSYLLNIIFYIILYNSDNLIGVFGNVYFLLFIFIFNVIPFVAYWTAHHVYIIRSVNNKNTGKRVGIIFAIPTLLGIVGPYLGSVLITDYGFKFIFFASTLLLMIGSGSLFFSSDIKIRKPKIEIKYIIDIKNIRKNLIYFMQGVGLSATGFLWPVFLFFSSVKLTSIGLLYFLSNASYSVVGYLSGKQSDKRGNRLLVQIGSFGHGLSIIFRSLASAVTTISIFQTMGGTFSALYHIPLECGYYKYSHKYYYNGTMNREVYMQLGRFVLILIFLASMFLVNMKAAFIITLIFAGLVTSTVSIIVNKDHSIIN